MRPNIYQRNEETSGAKADTDTNECESCETLRESICLGEDESVTVEKSEKNYIDDGQVECNKHDDGLSSSKQERPV